MKSLHHSVRLERSSSITLFAGDDGNLCVCVFGTTENCYVACVDGAQLFVKSASNQLGISLQADRMTEIVNHHPVGGCCIP